MVVFGISCKVEKDKIKGWHQYEKYGDYCAVIG